MLKTGLNLNVRIAVDEELRAIRKKKVFRTVPYSKYKGSSGPCSVIRGTVLCSLEEREAMQNSKKKRIIESFVFEDGGKKGIWPNLTHKGKQRSTNPGYLNKGRNRRNHHKLYYVRANEQLIYPSSSGKIYGNKMETKCLLSGD